MFPIYSVVRDCAQRSFTNQKFAALISPQRDLGLEARSSLLQVVGNHTAGDPPVPIPNTEVKPRWADCTARESVWESR